MSMIYVFGVLPNDSGKTTFSTALINEAKGLNLEVSAFKPLSGHSYWWQYNSYQKCLELKKLFSEDAYKLWVSIGKRVPIEVLNPADVLISVPDLKKIYSSRKKPLTHLMGNIYNWFYMGRFTYIKEGKERNVVYYKRRGWIIEAKELLDLIKSKAAETIPVSSSKDFLKLHETYYMKSVETCFNKASKGFNFVVVEGFNDSVYPWSGVRKADLAVGVSPGFILIFETKDLIREAKKRKTQYLTVFSDIANNVQPMKTERIPALRREEIIGGKVREKYKVAVNKTVEMVIN